MPKFKFDLDGAHFCLDGDLHSLTRNGTQVLEFSRKSKTFKLLELLVQEAHARPGVPVSHQYLLSALWPDIKNPTPGERTLITQQVAAIRRMLLPNLVASRRNAGYFIVPSVRTEPSYLEQPSAPRRPVHEAVVTLDVQNLPRFFELESPKASIGFRLQGVRGIDVTLGRRLLGALKCTIETRSPYFRFGLKLLERTGRLLGDAVIVTADNSCVLHLGRNSAPREFPRISERDIFLTVYKGAEQVGDGVDRKLFQTAQTFTADVEVRVEPSEIDPRLRIVSLGVAHVNAAEVHYREELDSSLLGRFAILVWADGNGCLVKLSNVSCSSTA